MVKVISCVRPDFSELSAPIRQGKTVIFPTDTVYGLGSSPLSQLGVHRCFEIKGRSDFKPMPVLFSDSKILEEFVAMDWRAKSLADKFWPGALTLILELKANLLLPKGLIGPHRSLAVRVPKHSCCLKLVRACGGALIGTSANVSGHAPFLNPKDPQLAKFALRADYFVTGKCGKSRVPSTIIDLTSAKIQFKREGAIAKKVILSYLEKTSKTDFSSR